MGKIQYTNLKAFAHPSTFKGFNDTHIFVKAQSGENYSNCGGIYEEDQCSLAANGLVYKTWLLKFMPNQTTNFKETGLEFNVNGVCHTYAMRELLLCLNCKDVTVAEGEDLCMMYYGKYGCGLKYLEQRLRESFAEARKQENIPVEALDEAIRRIHNTENEETEAWIKTMRYINIDVLSFFRADNDWCYLKNRITNLMVAREKLFDSCFDAQRRTLDSSFATKKKTLYIEHFNDYMQFLTNHSYITEAQRNTFCMEFAKILAAHGAFYANMAAQCHEQRRNQ